MRNLNEAATVVCGLLHVLNFIIVIGHYTINIPKIFQPLTVFLSLTVKLVGRK